MASARRNTLCTEILRYLLNSIDEVCEETVVDVYRARSKKCRKCNIHNDSDLVDFLEEYSEVFKVFRDRGQDCVVPSTQLTLCPVHSQKSGSCRDRACTGLHFCIFYLLSGQCAFASSNHSGCLFGHALEADPHNRRLLQQQSFLVGLNLTELRRLFCLPGVRRGVTVPKICRYYNKHRGCSKGGKCRALHLCHPYVLETCKFGVGCRRNHDISQLQVEQVLTLYGVRVKGRPLSDILRELRRFPGEEKRDEAGSRSDDDDDYDDRGRSHTGQAPAYRRSMSHNRSSSRAASRNRNGSSIFQMPPRPALQDDRETVHMTQQRLEQSLNRTIQLETELARERCVLERNLQQMQCLSPNDYRERFDNGIVSRRPPKRKNDVWHSRPRMDPPDYISPPVQRRPGRIATEHEMAEESSQASGSSLRNAYSTPPAQPLPDSMTQAKRIRNGTASQGVSSRPGSSSSRDTATKEKKKRSTCIIKEEKIGGEGKKGEKKRKLD